MAERISGKIELGAAKRPGAKRRTPPVATTPDIAWPKLAQPMDAQALALQFQFQESEWWPGERLLAFQMTQIRRLLDHAARTVPFHRARLAPLADGLATLSAEAFREIPVMRRGDIQEAGPALFATRLPHGHGRSFAVRSSGSTGRPIAVRGTGVTALFLRAMTMRAHLWHRRDLSAKNADVRTAFAPDTAPRRARWAPLPATGPTVRIDIALSIAEILEALIAENPAYVQTHPYTLLGLVERSRETGRRPAGLRQARVFGEALEPEVRKTIESAWGIPVIDNYSAMELGTIAHQCPESTALHVQGESVLVEVLREDGTACAAGETGTVVITALHNYATPLIRYEIGDYATVGEPCACGRGLPLLTRVMGRARNLMILPDGNKRFPELRAGGFEQIAPIRQFQLVQRTRLDLALSLVMAEPLTVAQEARIRDLVAEKFGRGFRLAITLRDDIPRAANGKFEEFRCEVDETTPLTT